MNNDSNKPKVQNPRVQIFLAYHKKSPVLKSRIFIPVQSGRNTSKIRLNMLSDDTGENIAEKNPYYSEMTMQYWVWKNINKNIKFEENQLIGFGHYRRVFSIAETPADHIINNFSRKTKKLHNWDNDKYIEDFCSEYDIIISPKWPVSATDIVNNKSLTLYEHYKKEHHIEHLDMAIEVIKQKYPEYEHVIDDVMNFKEAYFCNLYIMKPHILDDYMKWIFDILFEVESQVEFPDDFYQQRVCAFLPERLFNIYIEHKKRTETWKIKELDTVFVDLDRNFHINKTMKIYRRLKALFC